MGCTTSSHTVDNKIPVLSQVALVTLPTAADDASTPCWIAPESIGEPWLLLTDMMVRPSDPLRHLESTKLVSDATRTRSMSVTDLGRLLGGNLLPSHVHSVRVEYIKRMSRGAFVSRDHSLIAAVCGDSSGLAEWCAKNNTARCATGRVPPRFSEWYPPQDNNMGYWRHRQCSMHLRVWVRMKTCVLDFTTNAPKGRDMSDMPSSPAQPQPIATPLAFEAVITPAVTVSTVERLAIGDDLPALLQRFYIALRHNNRRCVRCNGTGTITSSSTTTTSTTTRCGGTHKHRSAGRPVSPASHHSVITVASATSQAHGGMGHDHTHTHDDVIHSSTTPRRIQVTARPTTTRKCTMCDGTGSIVPLLAKLNSEEEEGEDVTTFKHEEGEDVVGDEEEEASVCGVCLTDAAKFRLSSTCQHRFCGGCVKEFLSSELAKGSSNIRCPTCTEHTDAAATEGATERKQSESKESSSGSGSGSGSGSEGLVDADALSFLAFIGVIGQSLYHRILRQQGCLSGLSFFTCPAHGCDCALVTPTRVKPDRGGNYPVRMCPGCNSAVCTGCHSVTPVSGEHRCTMALLARQKMEHAKALKTLQVMRTKKQAKQCPKCKQWINKSGGCSSMMCGTRAHGQLRDAIRNGGCGYMFNWDTLAAKPGRFKDLNGASASGQPPEMFKDEIRRLRAELGFQPFPWEV